FLIFKLSPTHHYLNDVALEGGEDYTIAHNNQTAPDECLLYISLSEAAECRTLGAAGSAANTGNPRLNAVVRLWKLNRQANLYGFLCRAHRPGFIWKALSKYRALASERPVGRSLPFYTRRGGQEADSGRGFWDSSVARR
ncbi:MAG TPA: hypothetical protein P5244_06165, partial [Syntrophales bacterium]|nr:hypothetical protein [Syntrophales bacterium]HRT70491.1 hypothetical protein [Syntrophales bacterium]